MQVVKKHLSGEEFYQQRFLKKQIVWHHTAGSYSIANTLNGWETDFSVNKQGQKEPREVATAFLVAGNVPAKKPAWEYTENGLVVEAFPAEFWAHHLGTYLPNNKMLNMQSIGIEVCNYGILVKKGDNFSPPISPNTIIPHERVEELPFSFRGSRYYEKYSAESLKALHELTLELCKEFGIPLQFNGKTKGITAKDFELSPLAQKGTPGIFTHTNYLLSKSDLSPQKELIYLLNNL